MTVIPVSVFAKVGPIDHNTQDVSGRSLMTVMTQVGPIDLIPLTSRVDP
jgi:hypothetical protein